MSEDGTGAGAVPRFARGFFSEPEPITRIGDGEWGGKARGLVQVRDLLSRRFDATRHPAVDVVVPKMVVLTTDLFDRFLERNGLRAADFADVADDRIARAFLDAALPAGIVGDLRALVEEVRTPLAVRSSSLLEDALLQPFAGVYETKMVPNNQPDADARFRALVEAVKFVYASTWFAAARSYVRAAARERAEEKMAVIVQEVVGARHGDRFYPQVSGVARSYNFFPAKGVDPRAGVANLALGLGKTIVDGGASWIFCPARPKAPPPFSSIGEMLRGTQLDFWAVHMGRPPAHDPMNEAEYLVRAELDAADYDGTLSPVASTYDPARDRLVPGTAAEGPRVLDFAPLLGRTDLALGRLLGELLEAGERELGRAVEIEFALAGPSPPDGRQRFGFLQLRPMLVTEDEVTVGEAELAEPGLLLVSDRVMGNGAPESILDVVYVRPQTFEARLTPAIAGELDRLNRRLVDERRPYLLIGFGRWGSSDPWLGIPVKWGQIGGARVIVESTLPGMDVEPSQGAHFFHNIIAFRVLYLCVRHGRHLSGAAHALDWDWLDAQTVVAETEHVRHVRLGSALRVKVDGRSGLGAVWRPAVSRTGG